MSAPRISIVTVTLNCADEAVTTAQSVLVQDYNDYEYIVKDGGSIDGTVKRLQNLGVNVCVNPDQGIYDAMNQAVELCAGEYIYFLNAGDVFFSPNTLSKFFSWLAWSAPVLYGDICYMPMHRIYRYPNHLSRYYLFRKSICHQAVIIKRDCFYKYGMFDAQYRYVADQAMLWRLIMYEKLASCHVPIPLAQFFYGGFSTNRASINRVSHERLRLAKQFYPPMEYSLYWLANLNFLIPLKGRIWYYIFGKSIK